MVLERWGLVRGLIPWVRSRGLEEIFDEMERRFEEALGQLFFPVSFKRTPVVRAWSSPLEVIEKENEYIVKAEMPGMKEEEISR